MKILSFFSKLLLIAGLSNISFASDCQISIGYHFIPPILYSDDNGEIVGLDREIIDMITNKAGCESKWIQVPWARSLEMLKSGELTMNINALATKERAEFTNIIGYRQDTPNRLFVRKADFNSIKVNDLTQFLNKTHSNIGLVVGFNYEDEIEKLIKSSKYSSRFERIDNVESNIRKLINSRTDGFIMEQLLGNFFIRKHSLQDKITYYDNFAFGFDMNRKANLLVSKKADPDNKISNRLSKAIEELRNTKEYQDVLNKYF